MKKIVSFFAATALALGLIGCSGDLHDDALAPIDMTGYFIAGSMQNPQWKETDNSISFTKVEGTEYTYEATFTADADTINFAFLPTKDTWAGQIGGDKMKGNELPSNVTFEDTDNGNGGRNGTIKGLTAQSLYKMTVETSTGTFKISLKEAKEPKYFLLDGYFIRSLGKDWNGEGKYLLWNPVKDPVTGDVTYKVQFTATAETQQLALARQEWKDGRYECATATSFAVGADPITLEYGKEQHPSVTGLIVGRPYNVVVKTTTDGTVTMSVEQIKYIDVVGFKVINYDGDAEIIYFLNAWIPGNEWGWATPNKGTVSEKTASCSITSTRITADTINVQITDPVIAAGNERPVSGDANFWASKVADDKITVDNPKDFKVYIIVFDCNTKEFSLEPTNG